MKSKSRIWSIVAAIVLLITILVSALAGAAAFVAGGIYFIQCCVEYHFEIFDIPFYKLEPLIEYFVHVFKLCLLMLLPCLLCAALFFKKKKRFFVFSVACYAIYPIYELAVALDYFANDVSYFWADFLNFSSEYFLENMFYNVMWLLEGTSTFTYFALFSIAVLFLLVFAHYVCSDGKKKSFIVKNLFWLPATLYFVAIPLIWIRTLMNIFVPLVGNIIFDSSDRLKNYFLDVFRFENIVNCISIAIVTALTFIFLLLFGLWVRSFHKEATESVAITDIESQNIEE